MSNAERTSFGLLNLDVDKASEEELRSLVKHLQEQMKNTYAYWVGHGNGGNRACSTRNGLFVTKKEVIDYLS